MKTISVSGKGVKSTPVSLSKAAKYLAKFVDSDSGASEANLGFLKRASAAFNELNAFHKEIRKSKSRRRRGEGGDEEAGLMEDGRSGGDTIEVAVDGVKERGKKERKKQRDLQNDNLKKNGGGVEMGGHYGDVEREADGRKRKKLEDGEEGRFDNSEERKLKKKRKKNREDDA